MFSFQWRNYNRVLENLWKTVTIKGSTDNIKYFILMATVDYNSSNISKIVFIAHGFLWGIIVTPFSTVNRNIG